MQPLCDYRATVRKNSKDDDGGELGRDKQTRTTHTSPHPQRTIEELRLVTQPQSDSVRGFCAFYRAAEKALNVAFQFKR